MDDHHDIDAGFAASRQGLPFDETQSVYWQQGYREHRQRMEESGDTDQSIRDYDIANGTYQYLYPPMPSIHTFTSTQAALAPRPRPPRPSHWVR
jgi:hypothetical protein